MLRAGRPQTPSERRPRTSVSVCCTKPTNTQPPSPSPSSGVERSCPIKKSRSRNALYGGLGRGPALGSAGSRNEMGGQISRFGARTGHYQQSLMGRGRGRLPTASILCFAWTPIAFTKGREPLKLAGCKRACLESVQNWPPTELHFRIWDVITGRGERTLCSLICAPIFIQASRLVALSDLPVEKIGPSA